MIVVSVDTDDSVPVAALCPADWRDSAAPHATAASGELPAGTPDCSTAPAHRPPETSAHTPSANTVGCQAAADLLRHPLLDRHPLRTQTEEGPREPFTLHGSSLGEKLNTSSRGAFSTPPPPSVYTVAHSTTPPLHASAMGQYRDPRRALWPCWYRETGTVPDRY